MPKNTIDNLTDETPHPDEKPGFWHHVWYWIKLPIWYLIRDTDCPYCIFLRGVVLGVALTCIITGVVLWTRN